jgi:membrane protein implicated in regulation of membrane protease activity
VVLALPTLIFLFFFLFLILSLLLFTYVSRYVSRNVRRRKKKESIPHREHCDVVGERPHVQVVGADHAGDRVDGLEDGRLVDAARVPLHQDVANVANNL